MGERRRSRRNKAYVNTSKVAGKFSEKENTKILEDNQFQISTIKHELDYEKHINPKQKRDKMVTDLLSLNQELVNLNTKCLDELYILRNLVRDMYKSTVVA